MPKGIGILLLIVASMIYLIFQTPISVYIALGILIVGMVIDIFLIPKEKRLFRGIFYIVAIPFFMFLFDVI